MRRILRQTRDSRAMLLSILALAVGALIGAPGAAGITDSSTFPFALDGTNSCVIPAENFVATGNLHLSISGNLSGGGTATSQIQTSLQGLKAVTLTGKTYVVPGETRQSFLISDGPFHFTDEEMVQFIRQGDDGTYITGDDFYFHILFRVRIDANGVTHVDDVSGDTRCQ